MELQGIILQSIGGFYYVEAADAVYECRARGHFRKQGITPLAGDHVRISCQADGVGTLEEILPRKNSLIRPPVANLDCLVIVVSIAEPDPNPLVIDKMIALMRSILLSSISPSLIFILFAPGIKLKTLPTPPIFLTISN